MFMLCTFLVFYFCAASHGVIKNDDIVQDVWESVVMHMHTSMPLINGHVNNAV